MPGLRRGAHADRSRPGTAAPARSGARRRSCRPFYGACFPLASRGNLHAWLGADSTSSPNAASASGSTRSRGDARDRRARAAHGRGRGRRRHLEPDDLREGALVGRLVRRPAPRRARRRRPTRRRSSSSSRPRTCAEPATSCAGRGRTRARRRLRLDRGRSRYRVRPGRVLRAGDAAARARRPAERLREDSRHRAGPRRDRGLHRRRPLDQRHAHLLARAPRRRRRGVRARARAARRGRRRPAPVASVASFFVSRVDTEADRRLDELGRDDLQGKLAIANAKLAYQPYLDVFSGARWEALAAAGAQRAALPVGVDVDQEPRVPRRALRRGADRAGHGEHDAARDDRRLPGSRRGPRDTLPRASTRRARCSTSSPRPVSTTTTWSRRSSAKASRSSRTRSGSCWTASRRSARRSSSDAAVPALKPPVAQPLAASLRVGWRPEHRCVMAVVSAASGSVVLAPL